MENHIPIEVPLETAAAILSIAHRDFGDSIDRALASLVSVYRSRDLSRPSSPCRPSPCLP